MRTIRSRISRELFLTLCVLSLSPSVHADGAPPLDADVQRVRAQVLADYEAIHRKPERGKAEFETARLIRDRLQRLGVTEFHPVKGLPTAVVAVLDSGQPGPAICLRAEMDALPGNEQTKLPYASQVPNVMHSCGHDAHAAMLLGAAGVLAARKDLCSGKVVFVFQPAEEVAGGANDIVADGLLDRLGVTAVIAQHAAPGLPVGAFQISPGPALAAGQTFTVTVEGKGSHAAFPHEGGDVLLAAAEMAAGMAKLPARKLDVVRRPCIVSVASFHAGEEGTPNRIPPKAVFRGTIRAFEDLDAPSSDGGPSIRSLLEEYLQGMARAAGVTVSLETRRGAPVTANDPALCRRILSGLRTAWPQLTVQEGVRSMASEDFAYYTARYPSLYFAWGIARGDVGQDGVHTNTFTIHPDALAEGVRLLALTAQAATRAAP